MDGNMNPWNKSENPGTGPHVHRNSIAASGDFGDQ
jgi:hypothetical protein